MVKVKLFANFREVAGEKEVEIRASNIKDLVDHLVNRYPVMKDLVNKEDYLHVVVNGRYVNSGDYKDIPLTDEDVVTIFPPVSGG
ncbi:MAG: ubiquitin-like small modifier protein 1 [Archaeoglobaceae archaeon]